MTGKELRRLRESTGLSQIKLAALADVSYRTIIRWEMGQAPIPRLAALGLKQILEGQKVKK